MNLIITNGTIVTDRIIPNGTVVTIGSKIIFVGEEKDSQAILKVADPSVFKVIDAAGGYIAPGLVDVHLHGGDGVDFMDGEEESLRQMARFLARSGTVGFLPSTVTASPEKTRRAAEIVANHTQKSDEAEVLGIHLEGPYINVEKKGAQYGPAVRAADLDELEALYKILGDKMRLITLAPEMPGALEAIDWLVEKNITTSVGHSDASYEQTVAAFGRGLSYGTHLFNGMRGLHHREPGVVGALLADPNVQVELIPDLVHIHPGAMQVVLAAKPWDKINIISDAVQATGLPDGEYVLGDNRIYVKDGAARLSEGNLAGSTLTVLQGVRNMIEALDVPIVDAFRMGSKNPAESIGLQDKGWIKEGNDADFTIVTTDFAVMFTINNGKIIYDSTDKENA